MNFTEIICYENFGEPAWIVMRAYSEEHAFEIDIPANTEKKGVHVFFDGVKVREFESNRLDLAIEFCESYIVY